MDPTGDDAAEQERLYALGLQEEEEEDAFDLFDDMPAIVPPQSPGLPNADEHVLAMKQEREMEDRREQEERDALAKKVAADAALLPRPLNVVNDIKTGTPPEEAVHIHAQLFDREFEVAMQDIEDHRARMQVERPGDLKIATMTIMCRLKQDAINLDKVAACFESEPVLKLLRSYDDVSDALLSRRDADKHFHNAIILKYKQTQPRNHKAVKMFINGSLHITGCKSATECMETTAMVCRVLDIVHCRPKGTFAPVRFNVQLVNTVFEIPLRNREVRFDLGLLRETLFRTHGLDATFEPEIHAALNLKYNVKSRCIMTNLPVVRDVTLLTFDTGNIILTGVINAHELRMAYRFITSFLDAEFFRATYPAPPLAVAPDDGGDADVSNSNSKKKRKKEMQSVDGKEKKKLQPSVQSATVRRRAIKAELHKNKARKQRNLYDCYRPMPAAIDAADFVVECA